MKRSLFFTHWLPLLLWLVLIFALSHQPGNDTEKTSGLLVSILQFFGISPEIIRAYHIHFYVRKLAHFTEYFVLCLLMFRVVRTEVQGDRALLYSWLGTVFYAMTDEFHQSFIPGRGPAITDVCIDASGAALAAILMYVFLKRKMKFSLKFAGNYSK